MTTNSTTDTMSITIIAIINATPRNTVAGWDEENGEVVEEGAKEEDKEEEVEVEDEEEGRGSRRGRGGSRRGNKCRRWGSSGIYC